MAYLLLVVGFGLLIKGADLFVDGSSNIAKLLRISPIVIGLTIVAFGTSFPEATVSIIAALEDSADVAIGNVIGINIFYTTVMWFPLTMFFVLIFLTSPLSLVLLSVFTRLKFKMSRLRRKFHLLY